jgi:hypothetical protein
VDKDQEGLSTEALLADLQRSRTELAALRQQLEARSMGMPAPQHDRLILQAAELADQEQELLAAEQNLSVNLEERRAQQALAAARLRAVEAEIANLSG